MAPIVLSCLTRHYFRPLVMSGGNVLLNWNGMHQIISDYYWRRWLIQITLVARSLAQRGAWRWGTICHWHSLKMHCASCKMWWVTHVRVEFGHSHHMSSNQEFQTAAILTFLNSSGWRGNPWPTTLRPLYVFNYLTNGVYIILLHSQLMSLLLEASHFHDVSYQKHLLWLILPIETMVRGLNVWWGARSEENSLLLMYVDGIQFILQFLQLWKIRFMWLLKVQVC